MYYCKLFGVGCLLHKQYSCTYKFRSYGKHDSISNFQNYYYYYCTNAPNNGNMAVVFKQNGELVLYRCLWWHAFPPSFSLHTCCPYIWFSCNFKWKKCWILNGFKMHACFIPHYLIWAQLTSTENCTMYIFM